jgi:hypothetical protein
MKRVFYWSLPFLIIFALIFSQGCVSSNQITPGFNKTEYVIYELNHKSENNEFLSYKTLGTKNIRLNKGLIFFYGNTTKSSSWKMFRPESMTINDSVKTASEGSDAYKMGYSYEIPITVVAVESQKPKFIGNYEYLGKRSDWYADVDDVYVFEYPGKQPLGYFQMEANNRFVNENQFGSSHYSPYTLTNDPKEEMKYRFVITYDNIYEQIKEYL